MRESIEFPVDRLPEPRKTVYRPGNGRRFLLRTLPDQSVHCCVTSPPYWGLRDYGLEPLIWGGSPGCRHQWIGPGGQLPAGLEANGHTALTCDTAVGNGHCVSRPTMLPNTCLHCGAWRGQLGLEPVSEMYVQHLVEVFG